ncbi:hypothetical protein BU24DRAFT_144009 [Aaosphaeria arxii CBS 175.79]|uniref:Zn(2)-C6 fungal-type domain-containing protein n=1 Tax=Aaosphaeria arxii CBS 175.79 TaxID=1450172 RepID=A0A6A5XW10_9PLEO|nr:uncharacterized protein BU24DRAFT_144009 [Aaosphaeria arxii CBS 175.79]KAF2017126.1 hypothetical protein BU24DRAFT_144009 [Aaosphaeria arxii CBS 175.79]
MSSPTTQPADVQKPENTNNNAAAAPRKRRRRAPATGASEDCFTCRKRQIKCDRRRPYCGQCIEIGKECSGYRTTLTWGVGVASRGKLRGMSLPVPKSPTQTTNTARDSKSQTTSSSVTTAATPVTTAPSGPIKLESRGSVDFGATSPMSPTSPNLFSAPQEYQYLTSTSPIPIPSPTTPMGFSIPNYGEHMDPFTHHSSKLRRTHIHRGPLQRLQTSLHVPYEEMGLSASSASLGTYSDSDFPSPGEFPHTPHDEFPFAESSVPQYQSLIFHDQTPMSSSECLHFHEAPRSLPMADDMSSSISSDQSVQDYTEVTAGQHNMGPPAFPDIFIEGELSSSVNGLPQSGFPFVPSEGMSSVGSGPLILNESQLTTSIPQSLIASPLSPRMQFLLDYYDKFICHVLVAFDDTPGTNPYRTHVIPLAMRSEGLQNAIAALATNNMRMRGGIEGRRLSLPQNSQLLPDHAFSQMTTFELREMHGEATNEEKHYKANSITFLNQQLADPAGAHDDSVLATLLVLCLFHVCDSGFTKFKTQLAGVQKLLSMRDRSVQSNFIGWIEVFFTWFDVMTSTLNDRETEVQGDSLDMMNVTTNLGALEHYSGCEGRLFKLIARLGRLNLLSQNRPVRESKDTPRASPQPKQQRDFYSFNFDRLDGNGWGTPVHECLDPLNSVSGNELRSEFWVEWTDVRSRLETWKFDSTNEMQADACNRSRSLLTLSQEQAALLHISESFRYAALLYTERLAYPTPRSSAPNFQTLVGQGLFHISQIGITSCVNKFLLWPLFMIGTECVDPAHRAIVRQRCVEIQRESGFFNNLSGLEVLERVWQEDDERGINDEVQSQWHGSYGAQQQAFRWRKAMDRVDGEYIMI